MFTWFNVVQIAQQAHQNILIMLATAESLAESIAESLAGSTAESLAGLAADSVEMLADGNSPADWDYAADSFADPFADF